MDLKVIEQPGAQFCFTEKCNIPFHTMYTCAFMKNFMDYLNNEKNICLQFLWFSPLRLQQVFIKPRKTAGVQREGGLLSLVNTCGEIGLCPPCMEAHPPWRVGPPGGEARPP